MIRIKLSIRLGERRWTQAKLSREPGVRAATIVDTCRYLYAVRRLFDTAPRTAYHHRGGEPLYKGMRATPPAGVHTEAATDPDEEVSYMTRGGFIVVDF